ncbi:Toxin-antitoxin system, toxin component OS=Streptomyces glaucescens OX=1907 GN=SGLAU_31515 PE=4 SV=1 [Streptomyces glaucescens]
MDDPGARHSAVRPAAAPRHARTGSAMRRLTAWLDAGLRVRPRPPTGIRQVCHAVCEEMSAQRGGRPVELRFERFPDELEVTGLWVEFHDFDLVIVEERAEALQQLVILGHELWHLHAGHGRHRPTGTAATQALATGPGRRGTALTVAARDGSRQREEAEADDFGHRLAAAFRPLVSGEPGTGAPPGPPQRPLGHRVHRGTPR